MRNFLISFMASMRRRCSLTAFRHSPTAQGIAVFLGFSALAGCNYLFAVYHERVVSRASQISADVSRIQIDSLRLLSTLQAYVTAQERLSDLVVGDDAKVVKASDDTAGAPGIGDLHRAASAFRKSWPALARQIEANAKPEAALGIWNFTNLLSVEIPPDLRDVWVKGPTNSDLSHILALQGSVCMDICMNVEMSSFQRVQLTKEISDLVINELTPRLDQMRKGALAWRGDAIHSMSVASATGVTALILMGILIMAIAVVPQARRIKTAQTALRGQNETLEQQVALRTDELSKALVAADAASSAKTEFLKSINHEIRTPMNGVLGVAALLGATRTNERDEALVTAIKKSGQSMMRFLENAIEMANLSAGEFAPTVEDTCIEALVASTVKELEPTCGDAGVAIETEITTGSTPMVMVDRLGLSRVLSGVIRNAVQYSGAKTISVRASVSNAGADTVVQIDVKDDGVGIDQDAQRRIFSRFYRSDRTGDKLGAGLGLPIARMIMEAMGGSLSVDSTPGDGATFRISLGQLQMA